MIICSFPGDKKSVSDLGTRGTEQAKKDDDDDFDLFGSDDSEDEEVTKIPLFLFFFTILLFC